MASAGDFNGDGFADFIAGAPGVTNGGTGRVYLYAGGPALDAVCDGVLPGAQLDSRFGWNGAATGSDVTGDGEADIVIGAFRRSVSVSKAGPSAVAVDSRGRVDVYSNVQTVATVLENWSAAWTGTAVALEWRLSRGAMTEIQAVRVQRSRAATGPFQELAVLQTTPVMRFADADVEPATEYWYRIQFDFATGTVHAAGPYAVTTSGTPWRTALESVTSALREGTVQVRYTLGVTGSTLCLDVLDVRGRRIRTLEPVNHGPGRYVANWDQTDGGGKPVGRGVYLVRFQADGVSATRKVVVIRR